METAYRVRRLFATAIGLIKAMRSLEIAPNHDFRDIAQNRSEILTVETNQEFGLILVKSIPENGCMITTAPTFYVVRCRFSSETIRRRFQGQ